MAPTPAIAALAALALAAAGPPQADEPGYTLADAAAFAEPLGDIVDAEADRYRRMTVPVTIEGGGPYRFMVDTGSQTTAVSRRLGARLQLPTLGTATVIGMAGSKEVELVRLDGLELASRMFDNLEVPVLEAEHMGADGILGLDSLQDLRVVIDFRAESIAVDDARALGGDRGYEIIVRARNKKGRLIITDAEIDGVRTAVIVDTGSQGSIGNLALQRRLRARKLQEVTSTDVTGAEIVGRLDVPRTLQIGGAGARTMMLEGLYVNYADAPAFAALGLADRPAMVLGVEDLRMFDRIAIDFAERTVLFDLPGGARRPRSVDTLGA
ncbi:retroviral-like aspartic protease family protein [Tsuneonella sp. YG55]|uniref:Retroviral-like aspartic protease family protein n=1 Tax=Tsuneonella litorea TaxID=2976475 RepID=A0A9X2VY01_9SPHN|nr:retropepsin-like aspartic protease [Tsuneonella litorea]MCT2557393.1 retroviral-like aspartic protease family protein [Tsuneonella litorea]